MAKLADLKKKFMESPAFRVEYEKSLWRVSGAGSRTRGLRQQPIPQDRGGLGQIRA